MNYGIKTYLLMAALAVSGQASAQLSTNPDKFLGNITTDWPGSMDYSGFKYSDYWNQVTPENGTKWSTVEGTRGQFNWYGADPAFNYAKNHDLKFKFHTLVWGSQYPSWIENLSAEERYKAIVKWMDKVKAKYPNLEMIDVVNEAVGSHQAGTKYMREALGGDGTTGYDWIIKAFELARERWPEAILIYNDFNTFQWDTDAYIALVKALRDAGAPIDAYGCQSHDLGGVSKSTFATVMKKIQDALKMPMYITEYDIGDVSDANQKWNFQQHFPVMWEADYCAGVTVWGWFYGHTWIDSDGEKGTSGLIKNNEERSALKWLREYMQTDAAKNAKSPFPGMKMEAMVYIKPSTTKATIGETINVNIDAKMRTKTIQSVELFMNDQSLVTMVGEPYMCDITPSEAGHYDLKAVVTTTDGATYERWGGFDVFPAREPYNEMAQLPGTLEVENFDCGAEGQSYHDSDTKDEGDAKYRNDNGGVDLVKGNGGVALGYTAQGEWLEYTVDVTEAGEYSYEAVVASGNENSAFSVSLVKDGKLTQLFKVNVPKTGSDWSTYVTRKGKLSKSLEKGQQVLRLTIDGPYANIDKLKFTCTNPTGIETIDNEQLTIDNWYDLQGRKVEKPVRKGVYINNGKKQLR
jgi:GH35 family endo-1,4-beta-xylanase